MLMGGNAIDSSIATMYCNTVVNSQSLGIGGGFIMTVYMANGTRVALIARETAPAAASKAFHQLVQGWFQLIWSFQLLLLSFGVLHSVILQMFLQGARF